MKASIAAIQMTSGVDIDHNLETAERLIASAAAQGANVVVLPENFAIFDSASLLAAADQEHAHQRFSHLLAAWSKRYSVWLVGGTLPFRNRVPGGDPVSGQRVRTRSLVYSPLGQNVAAYDKIHLFDVDVADAHGSYRESDVIEPGNTPVVVDLPWARLGLTICYDLRFPELFSYLVREGATLLSVPAAFTYVTGQAHWLPLLRARAIETQCFIIAPNQVGENRPNRRTWGHSCIISPWGEILAVQEEGEGVVMASVDFAEVDELRKKMPLVHHKRFGITAP